MRKGPIVIRQQNSGLLGVPHPNAPVISGHQAYTSHSGQGSQTFATGTKWRATLLGTAAASALLLGYGRSALAGCADAGTTVTCTGDLNNPPSVFVVDNGIIVPDATPPGIDTLNVNTLDAPITPGAGTDGINFTRTGSIAGDITIDAETSITTTGDDAQGIFAKSDSVSPTGAATSGAVMVTQEGDITTSGEDSEAINAYSKAISYGPGSVESGDVTVSQTGDITTTGEDTEAMFVRSRATADNGVATAGFVTVTQTGDITTTGDNGIAIDARSIADGDGDSAYSDTVTVKQYGDITTERRNGTAITAISEADSDIGTATSGDIVVGQYGDIETSATEDGAEAINAQSDASADLTAIAGTVDVTQEGDITTGGENAYGIFARSKAYSNNGAATSDTVAVTQTGDITTGGENAQGIIARSYAGASTTATSAAVTLTQTGEITTTGTGSEGVLASSGAFSSTGNANSGEVSVEQTGNITSTSRAINAFNFATSLSASATAGDVTVTQTGDITVTEDNPGIVARSSATSTGANGVAQSGVVTVTQTGDITTTTDNDEGIEATSRATSFAGAAISDEVNITQTGNINTASTSSDGIFADSYADGATTADSGAVTVMQTGDISSGESDGIFARSVAYGYAGNATSGIVTVTQTGDITSAGDFDFGITARSTARTFSGTAESGAINVTQTGNITVMEDDSGGISARSEARSSLGYAYTGKVMVNQTGDITATGVDTVGIVARSYTRAGADATGGGVAVTQEGDITATGGGSEGVLVSSEAFSTTGNANSGEVSLEQTGDITSASRAISAFNFATSSSASATAGDVTVTQTGDITVTEDNPGIVARSLATNDGATGDAQSGVVTVTQTGDITTTTDNDEGIEATSRATSFAGAAISGEVDITQTGNINTASFSSDGISAQSTAYGGTTADSGAVTVMQTGDISSGESDGIFARSVAYGYAGNATSGIVTVTQTGDITSAGDFDYGITARSTARTLSGTAESGAINVTQTGNITVMEDDSGGISARSDATVSVGNATSGTITVTKTGDIMATGLDTEGIYTNSEATSLNAGTEINGNISIALADSTISSASSEGVEFANGATNTLTINNDVSISGGTFDVLGGVGDETIDNHGTLTTLGNVDLGDGANAFNNFAGAMFNSGAMVNLGPTAGNTLTNDGVVSPGGGGSVETTALTGNFVQSETGTFTVDIDGVTFDSIAVTGTALALKGSVTPNLVSFASLGPFAILTTPNAGDLSVDGVDPITATDTLTVDYELTNDTQNLYLSIVDVDFAIDGLNQNQTNIAEHFNAAFDIGGGAGGLGPAMAGLGNLMTLTEFAGALDQLSPEIYLDTQIAALYSSDEFSDLLLSCATNQPGALSIAREGQCAWVASNLRYLEQDGTSKTIGFNETSAVFAAGAQIAVDEVWRAGFGLGYRGSSLDGDAGATSTGNQVQGGLAVKYNPNDTLLAAIFSGGRGWYDSTRPMGFGGFEATAEGDYTVDVLAGRLHASHVFGSPAFYFKPMVDAAMTWVNLGDFTETGGGGANLVVDGNDHTVFTVSPAIELGTQHWLANGNLVRPFARAGVTWFSDDSLSVSSSFTGTPDGVAPFSVSAQTDEWLADLAVGVEMVDDDNNSVRVFYDGHFGDTTQSHSAGIKGSKAF